MRYLGIDYGAKRIGIAISDPNGAMAFPRVVLDATDDPVAVVVDLCKKESVEKIVVGESVNLDGAHNPIMKKITAFAEELARQTGLPLAFISEVYSSEEAKRTQGDHAMGDASAAAIILQSYLDRERSA